MPTLDFYRSKKNSGMTIGQHHKQESDSVIEHTWDSDIASRVGWFYDQEHDDQFYDGFEINPEKSKTKIPVEIKFYEMEYNSLAKDEVSQHIMFKPSYVPNVPYYDDKFKKPLGSSFPVGLYCDIADSYGVYHRWLVVGSYREFSNQFPSYLVLPCDYLLSWIWNGRKMQSWIVRRSQSSYNSGRWTDYRITSIENQRIIWMPTNDAAKTIFYDQRFAISAPREEPIVWAVSKVEEMNVRGISRFTCVQDLWDSHKDYVEVDKDGNVKAMWCNYFESQVSPKDPIEPSSSTHAVITYSGTKPEIKIGGSYKTFTVKFYDANDGEIPYQTGSWKFTINGEDATGLLAIKNPEENQIKVKFAGDDSYIGNVLTIGYETAGGLKTAIMVDLVGM